MIWIFGLDCCVRATVCLFVEIEVGENWQGSPTCRKEERERSRPRQPEEGAEKSVDVTVPQNLEELEAAAQTMPQERAQYRTLITMHSDADENRRGDPDGGRYACPVCGCKRPERVR